MKWAVLAIITLVMQGCIAKQPPKEMESLECKFKAEDCDCSFILRLHPKQYGETSIIEIEEN